MRDKTQVPETTPGVASVSGTRCEACELTAARMAYAAGLGASEWAAFIDRVAPCDDCRKVQVLRGQAPASDPLATSGRLQDPALVCRPIHDRSEP